MYVFFSFFFNFQISPMLASAFSESTASTASFVFVGLSHALALAANDILRLSEQEPYGIRGATLILKLRYAPSGFERSMEAIIVSN
jgi:hypothetical protein